MRKKRKPRARGERVVDPTGEAADGADATESDQAESADAASAEAGDEASAEAGDEAGAEAGDEASAEAGDEGYAGEEIPAPEDEAALDIDDGAALESSPEEGEEVAGDAAPAEDDDAETAAEGEEVAGDAAPADDGPSDDPDAELTPAFSIEPARLKSILESLLFAAEKPLSPLDLKRLTGFDDTAAIQAALASLTQDYADRGVSLYDVAGGFQFRTHPANSEYVQRLVVGRPVRLSRAQLETLAIVAYRQPVTRPEIDDIRGVDSGSTLKVLLDRSLIRVLGKKEEPGRPLLYGTSKEFLEFFNLSELRDLPTLREFHELTEESLREVEALDQAGQETEGEDASGAADGGNGGAESADQGEGASGVDEDADDDDDGSSPSASH